MLLELKGVSKSFGSLVVADGIDLTVNKGDALGSLVPMALVRRRCST